jgi:pyrrolidone-carboxylate peptidase
LRLELFGTNYINGVDNNNHSKIGEIENTNTFSIGTKFPLSTIDQIISLYPDSVLKSESAGKYLCNFLYYKSIVKFPEKDILFIHLANFYDLAAALSAEIQVEIVAALIKYKSKNT